MIRVLAIDDANSFRVLLRYVLPQDGDIELAAEAATFEDGVAAAAADPPDVVITDLNLAPGEQLTTLAPLRAAAPGARIVLLSGRPADELADCAASLGADAFVEKAADPAALRETVRRVIGT